MRRVRITTDTKAEIHSQREPNVQTLVSEVDQTAVSESSLPVELTRADCLVSNGLFYLYRAPFTPSVFYDRGSEHFIVPAGWGVLRSKEGILIWLQLNDDSALTEALQQGQFLASGTVRAPPQEIQAYDAGLFALCLARPSPTLTGGIEIGKAQNIDVSVLGKCKIDGPVRIPCQDVALIRPKRMPEMGLWASLGSPTCTFDQVFNAWIAPTAAM